MMFEVKKTRDHRLYYYQVDAEGKRKRISYATYQKQNQKQDQVELHHKAASKMSHDERMVFKDFLHSQCFKTEFQYPEQMALPGIVYWLADEDKKIASVLCFETGSGMIYNVCTALGHQRKGYARTLLRRVLSDHRQQDVNLHVWTDNAPAIALYESLGFQTLDTVAAAGARSYLVMRKHATGAHRLHIGTPDLDVLATSGSS